MVWYPSGCCSRTKVAVLRVVRRSAGPSPRPRRGPRSRSAPRYRCRDAASSTVPVAYLAPRDIAPLVQRPVPGDAVPSRSELAHPTGLGPDRRRHRERAWRGDTGRARCRRPPSARIWAYRCSALSERRNELAGSSALSASSRSTSRSSAGHPGGLPRSEGRSAAAEERCGPRPTAQTTAANRRTQTGIRKVGIERPVPLDDDRDERRASQLIPRTARPESARAAGPGRRSSSS